MSTMAAAARAHPSRRNGNTAVASFSRGHHSPRRRSCRRCGRPCCRTRQCGTCVRGYLGEAIRLLDRLRQRRGLVSFVSPKPLASRIFVPIPSFLAVSTARASASPYHLTLTPICARLRWLPWHRLLADRTGAAHQETASRPPSARATPMTKRAAAKSLTAFSRRASPGRIWPTAPRITCGAPFGD